MPEQISTKTLTHDPGYRWNDNLTEDMSREEIKDYLVSEAFKYESIEWEVAYGIYRELVWRFPELGGAWLGFANSARHMGRQLEANAAQKRASELDHET